MNTQTETAPSLADSALLGLVADIRAAVGDPKGKLMQDELVAHCRSMRSALEKLATAGTILSRNHDGGRVPRVLVMNCPNATAHASTPETPSNDE